MSARARSTTSPRSPRPWAGHRSSRSCRRHSPSARQVYPDMVRQRMRCEHVHAGKAAVQPCNIARATSYAKGRSMAGSPTTSAGTTSQRFTAVVLLAAAISAISSLLYGYDTGIISGALLQIRKDFHTGSGVEQVIAGSILLGAALGALACSRLVRAAGPPPHRAGHRLHLRGGHARLAPSRRTPGCLSGARVVLGFAVGGATQTVPMYVAELAPAAAPRHAGAHLPGRHRRGHRGSRRSSARPRACPGGCRWGWRASLRCCCSSSCCDCPRARAGWSGRPAGRRARRARTGAGRRRRHRRRARARSSELDEQEHRTSTRRSAGGAGCGSAGCARR